MKYLLISGAPNTGKTETIYDLTNYLIDIGYVDTSAAFISPKPIPVTDFRCVLEKANSEGKNIKILINSATDDAVQIDKFCNFYKLNSNVDIIITSIRDGVDNMRDKVFQEMKINEKLDIVIELPLSKITRRNNFDETIDWYLQTINKLIVHLLRLSPFNL